MNFTLPAAGQRTLRLLTITSAVLLAACGGGGDGAASDPEAPVALTTAITSKSQMAVAADVGTMVSSLNPMGGITIVGSVIPDSVMVSVDANAAPAKVTMANPSAVLLAAARKLVPAAPATRLAAGATTTENVACTKGSGTYAIEEIEDSDSLSASILIDLKACETTIGEGIPVVMNGQLSLKVKLTDSKQSYSVVATQYSVTGEGFKTLLDGDMAMGMSLGEASAKMTVSGTKFTIGQTGTPTPVVVSADVAESRTVTLSNYVQVMVFSADSITIDSAAHVETDTFGAVATYQYRTTTPLVFVPGDIFKAGRIKVVGASDTILYITANGDGTFKLERDDGGDGTIDDEVSPVEASDINLQYPYILA